MADKDKRKRQREAIERPPGPGIAGTLGRGFGSLARATGESQLRQAEMQRLQGEAMARGLSNVGSAVAGSFRRFGEGFSSGAEGREFDPNRAVKQPEPEPPQAPGLTVFGDPARQVNPSGKEESADQQFAMSPVPGAPQPQMSPVDPQTLQPRSYEDRITKPGRPNIPAPEMPPAPPQTLTSAAGNTFPTGGGTGGGAFNPQEDAVPEDFVEIIRGTDRTYSQQRDGRFGREFRALPGMSLQESQKAAAAESPGFQFLQEQDLERGRVNAQTINAEANMTQALYSNSVQGYDDNGYPATWLPRQDRSGYDRAAGISPVLAQAASQIGRFTWQETTGPDGMPILVMGDSTTGQTNNVTLEQGLAVAQMALDNWGRSEGYGNFADIPQDELDDFIDEQALAPSIEAALRQRINNSPARQGR